MTKKHLHQLGLTSRTTTVTTEKMCVMQCYFNVLFPFPRVFTECR